MIRVIFTPPRGEPVTAEAAPGDNLLRVGQGAGLPLEGLPGSESSAGLPHVQSVYLTTGKYR